MQAVTVMQREPLPMADALVFAEDLVKKLPHGTLFTSMKFFAGVEVEGKKNVSRMAILFYLQGKGLIRSVGATKRDQESRNGGWATEWVVV